jgi:L-ascorbate metabolism protein UlaG (beta-lactamase superfamily)
MKKALFSCFLVFLTFALVSQALAAAAPTAGPNPPTLTLIGHSSIKIVTSAGTVLYIDPYAKGDYSQKADIILASHEHSDHNKVSLCKPNDGCLTLRLKQTISPDGTYNTFNHLGVLIEPFPAYNSNHYKKETNGYVITFDGIAVYFASDTSKIPEMDGLAARAIDYAFYPIDGEYNMNAGQAMECAAIVKARHNVPMHWFSADPSLFNPENLLFIPYGETVTLAGL